MVTREFVCRDCGMNVVSFGEIPANDQDLCAECNFLRSIENPTERELLRRRLRPGGDGVGHA